MAKNRQIHLPPGCGEDLSVPLLINPYQQAFQAARRARFCLDCKSSGSMDMTGTFTCPKCQKTHVSNLTAPRLYDRLLVLAGRGGGKTLIGAHAAREEMMVPNSIGWVMGPTYKILHDSTFPTLVRLIPPDWIKRWDPEHMEITLTNNALVAFRSLEDPERARGPHGVGWGWFDEAAQCPERGYDVFEPTLTKAGGIVICTTTVIGFDWTYDKIEKQAMAQQPGYWFTRFWTEENPLFASSPVMKRQIERARLTMTPEFFAQEYRAERRNAEGLVYDWKQIDNQMLPNDDAIKKFIPEWPVINPERPTIIGLDSGADHPFGAVKVVVTERGLVVVQDYLERMKAISSSLEAINADLLNRRVHQINPTHLTWAANKNEANLRLEAALKNIDIFAAESKHEVGIQRVQSWLLTGQLFFAYTAKRTIEQMQAYRYADNRKPDGQKKNKEEVFKVKDELPDALRYALMAWPELPEAKAPVMSDREQKRWDALDEKTRQDILAMRAYEKRETDRNLSEKDEHYPMGDFFGNQDRVQDLW